MLSIFCKPSDPIMNRSGWFWTCLIFEIFGIWHLAVRFQVRISFFCWFLATLGLTGFWDDNTTRQQHANTETPDTGQHPLPGTEYLVRISPHFDKAQISLLWAALQTAYSKLHDGCHDSAVRNRAKRKYLRGCWLVRARWRGGRRQVDIYIYIFKFAAGA